MVSYADFHKARARRKQAMEQGLRVYLGVPEHVQIYLDNGAFYFISREGETPKQEYEEFVREAQPDWRPVPQDFIPIPGMSIEEQQNCLTKTMEVNRSYEHDGFVPVIHISKVLPEYIRQVKAHEGLMAKQSLALGGIVPNLLRAPKAMRYSDVLAGLRNVRREFQGKRVHVFGLGGTATIHLGALLDMDSADSSGWRNRAARGIVQLPGGGDRLAAELGSWRGRKPTEEEWRRLAECTCPACTDHGVEGLKRDGIAGFCNRATHNLWVLLEEARAVNEHLAARTYHDWYRDHLDNSTYLRLITTLAETRTDSGTSADPVASSDTCQ